MRETRKHRRAPRRRLQDILIMAIMSFCVLIILYPFFIMLFVSVKSTKEALISPSSLPTEFHWENFVIAWQKMNFLNVFKNSVFVTSLSLIGIIILSGLAAYIIAWSKYTRFYNFLYLFFLCGIMIPFYTSLVPLVKLMTALGLTNSRVGMTLYYCGRNMPMAVFLYTGFIRGIKERY
ncbi:MAG: hypothetical protein Q4C59_06915 [Lachnospiraceae bacterium]|nr:hypothetical protein [Lachnospiraceae bacterium]